jgi:hypothetical protein
MLVDVLQPAVDFTLGLILLVAVALLQTAGELRALALDLVEIVIGQVRPFLLHLALELLPVAFDAIPIHLILLLCVFHSVMAIQHRLLVLVPRSGTPAMSVAASQKAERSRSAYRLRPGWPAKHGGRGKMAGCDYNPLPLIWFRAHIPLQCRTRVSLLQRYRAITSA